MNRHVRKAVSLLFVFLLSFELIPIAAYADEIDDPVPSEEESTPEVVFPEEDALPSEEPYDITIDEYAGNIPSAEKGEVIAEVHSRRDEYQKEFMLESGMNLVTVYPMPVHYENAGEWDEIDNTLVLNAEDKKYHNAAGVWDAGLPAVFDNEEEVVLKNKGYELSFRLVGEITEKGEEEPESEISEEADADTPNGETPDEESDASAIEEEITPKEEYIRAQEESDPAVGMDAAPAPEPEYIEINGIEYELIPTREVKGDLEPDDYRYARTGSIVEEILQKVNSGIRYSSIFECTELRYDLISNKLKESVEIQAERPGLVGYRYEIRTELNLTLTESGDIRAYTGDDPEDAVFYMPSPFMYDGKYAKTDEVEVILEKIEGPDPGYLLTYILPLEWLSNSERVYPVTLDPVVSPAYDQNNIRDQSVGENYGLSYTWGCLEVGRFPNGTGRERIFMKFNNIPSLSSADVVVSASVSLYQVSASPRMAVEAHKVNGTWDSSSITWSNMPGTNSLIEDHVICDTEGWKTWDITGIAQEWYYSDINTGVMLKAEDAIEGGSTEKFVQFYSSDFSGLAAPVLQIAYVNNSGLENIWDYSSQSAGRAGTGYVNLYTGNLVWEHDAIGFSGNRMPVDIKLTYNANDKGNNSFNMGYGWRSNFNQLVYRWSEDSSYYVWEDGDGTRHYFKYKSTGVYENELDSKMTLTTTGGGGTVYCISEEGSSIKTYFDGYGRLSQITNYQASPHSISIVYSGSTKYILTITDGAGRRYAYSYNGQTFQGIYYFGTQTTTVERIYYTQVNNELTGVTYPDGETTAFTYTTNHLLSGVTDVNGARIGYTYSSTGSSVPNRVTKVEEYGAGELTSAGSLALTYTRGQTKLVDHLHHTRILQFNNWGSTTCVQNDLGQAIASRYVNTDPGSSDNRKTGSQVSLNSKLQDTVNNLVLNGGFEKGMAYWSLAAGTSLNGTREVVTADKYMGASALKLTQYSESESNSPGDYRLQTASGTWHYAVPGEVYTVSAYIKVKSIENSNVSGGNVINGSGAYISLGTSEADHAASVSEKILPPEDEDLEGWVRVEATLKYPEGISDNRLMVFLHMESFGTAYFDCVQLERSATAGRFNLIENGDFDFPRDSSDFPLYWTRWHGGTSAGVRTELTPGGSAAPYLDESAVLMTGSPDIEKTIYQDIPVSGSAGDVYTLSGWGKADSVPLRDNRSFTLIARFVNTDNTTTDTGAVFTPAVGRGGDWQYASGRCVAKKDYRSIRIVICYSYNANTVIYDGIQFFKEEYGKSFTYDSDGNVISVKDLREQETTYEYNVNNDLTKIVLSDGASQKYSYDSYHNVIRSESPEGVYARFTYDQYGNQSSVQIGSSPIFKASAEYIAGGNQLSYITDASGDTTYYGYNNNTGELEWLKRPGETDTSRTNYSYDSTHRLTGASQTADGVPASSLYEYGNDTDLVDRKDLLSGITSPSGTVYGFRYNDLYQLDHITIGDGTDSRTLLTNSYDQTTHYLTGTLYGNSDSVSFTYDDFGRVRSAEYEDGEEITYSYNSEGNLGLLEQGDRKTRYFYDFQGELRGIDTVYQSGSQERTSLHWEYNEKNNLTKTIEIYSGARYETNYTYDLDNRLTEIREGNDSVKTTYSGFNDIVKIERGTYSGDTFTPVITSTPGYERFPEGAPIYGNNRITGWKEAAAGEIYTDLTYEYDSRGNITRIDDGTYETRYSYDLRDQLIREDNEKCGRTWVYTYSPGGNILSKTEYYYTEGTLGTPISTIDYTYQDDLGWKDLLTEYDGQVLTYDGMGNLTSDGTWDYTWKHGSELSGMAGNGDTLSFSYDAEGVRLSKNSQVTGLTRYYYTLGKLSVMTVDSGTGPDTLHFTYDVMGPSTVTYNGALYYYIRNAQGDVTGIVDSLGDQVVTYTFDAWGKLLSTTDTTSFGLGDINPLRYRGYVYDSETELYYLKSRYYDPEMGRFISSDSPSVPTISPDSATLNKNLFSYCDNNPVNKVDSDGLFACAIICGLVSGCVNGFFSYADGYGFGAGFKAGFVSGAISGVFLDFLLNPATLLTIPLFAGAAFAFLGGVVGSIAGDAVYEKETGVAKEGTEKWIDACISGLFNAASFGVGSVMAREAGSKTITQYLTHFNASDLAGAFISTAFEFTAMGFKLATNQLSTLAK